MSIARCNRGLSIFTYIFDAIRAAAARSPGSNRVLLPITLGIVACVPALGAPILEIGRVSPQDGSCGDSFGTAAALDQSFLVVGAPQDLNGSGSAYVFDRASGAQIAKLVPTDSSPSQRFGGKIAIDGGLIAVGTRRDTDNGFSAGAVYLFDAASGEELEQIYPEIPAVAQEFGSSVAVSGGLLAVGALGDGESGYNAGAAYIFDLASRSQLVRILPPAACHVCKFGSSVALEGGVLAVGAPGFDGPGGTEGAVLLFDADTGAPLGTAYAPTQTHTAFGATIAMTPDLLVVGDPQSDASGVRAGAAFVYRRSDLALVSVLVPAGAMEGDSVGRVVAVIGGVVAVSAYRFDTIGESSGIVSLFDPHTGVEIGRLQASDAESWDRLGSAIAVHGESVVAGALGDSRRDGCSGSVYVYAEPLPCGTADMALPYRHLDAADIGVFVGEFLGLTPRADLNRDGLYDLTDLTIFAASFSRGCP